MASRIVFYGSINNAKREELIKQAREYLIANKGDKFYYILPNGKLIQHYRKKLLEGIKGAFDLNVFTFDDVVKSLLKGESYTPIDSETKEAVISMIMDELCNDGLIKYYRDLVPMEGFVKGVSGIIGEIRRSLITAERFNEEIPDSPFFKEIGLVYEKYETFLRKNNLMDKEEYFFRAIELLKGNNNLFDGIDFIIIDEFFDFRPQELEILKEILKTDTDVYINIPYKTEKQYGTIENTLNVLANLGFEIVQVEEKEKSFFDEIGENIFSYNDSLFSGNDYIKLIKAPNKYLELKRIAQEIKILANTGIDLEDIALVSSSSEEYLTTMFRVFKEEKIPCSLNEEQRLIDIPIVKEFLNIIQLKIKNYDKSNMIKRIKSSYFSVCSDIERDKYEYIFYGFNYGNIEELKSMLNNKKMKVSSFVSNGKEEYADELNILEGVEKAVENIENEIEKIPKSGTPKDIVSSLVHILDSYDVSGKLMGIYKITNDYDMFYRDVSALERLHEILNKAANGASLTHDEIEIGDLYNILKNYLDGESIVLALGNEKGVNILTPNTIRGLKYKVVFIFGLIQGEYPRFNGESFFFKEDTFSLLKDIGMDISNYEEKLDKESLLFAIAISRCEEYLYLSYSENSLDGEINIPSMFLDELLSILEGGKVEDKVHCIELDMDYLIKDEIKEVTTRQELIRNLLYRYYQGEDCTEYFQMLNGLGENILHEINERIQCEVYRNKDELSEYSGYIGDENVRNDIYNGQKDLKFSATYLETYGKCHYKFLMDYILKIDGIERNLEEFSPLDKGNIYHRVLKEIYKKHKYDFKQHILGDIDFNFQSIQEDVVLKIKNILNENGIEKINKLWELRIGNMANNILNLMKADLERLRRNKVKVFPYDFEVEFGYEDDFYIDLGDKKVKLAGKIDRIDKTLEEDKFVVYDYKTSSYGVKKVKDMIEGTSLQLPIYIMAQDKKEVIAGCYINISKSEFSFELVKDEEKEVVNKTRGNGILSKEEWDGLMDKVKEWVKEYITGICHGDFSVAPKVCNEYCRYKDICRYNGRQGVK